jgi:hypothetical protein
MKRQFGGHWARVLGLMVSGLALLVLSACEGDPGPAGQDVNAQQPIVAGTFSANVLPLFTQDDKFFEGGMACTACHIDNTIASAHELNLTSYNGILTGADAGAEDIMGRTGLCVGSTDAAACPPNWSTSGMRLRLRNNRMPPNWPFDFDQANRNTSEIKALQGWVTDGALLNEVAGAGGKIGYDTTLANIVSEDATGAYIQTGSAGAETAVQDFRLPSTTTIAQLFTKDDVFFPGSQGCADCHNSFTWASHEMDLGSYAGILNGADYISALARADILGRTVGTGAGQCATPTLLVNGVDDGTACAPVWAGSVLQRRLRNSRMPPGWQFQLNESNRDMWAIKTIECWVRAGAPNGAYDASAISQCQ